MALNAAAGLAHIHQEGVLHRDLSARNCLVTSEYILKIADFGLASLASTVGRRTADRIAIRWMAPECLISKQFTTSSDIYSFGMLLYELMLVRQPFESYTSPNDVLEAITIRHELPMIPNDFSPFFSNFMRSCWLNEPSSRPSALSIVQMLQEYLNENFPNLSKQSILSSLGSSISEFRIPAYRHF